ncbi:MAG: metal ABC transporter permease [Thermodesulfobacteriota bacterium]
MIDAESIMTILLEPMGYEFFRHGLLAALMVGGLCGLIGVYIVLRGMSYIGHGLSHAAFGGAVVAYIMQVNFYIGAGLWGFLAAILINRITRKKEIKADAAIGIVTTASFAIGVAIISSHREFTLSFEAALFGNILAVTPVDLWVIGLVALIAGGAIFFMHKGLLFTTFDMDTARIFGIKTNLIETIFSLILAASIIVSMNIIGVTMIAAAIVIPATTARMLTNSFNKIVAYSTIIGAVTSVLGIYLSYYLDTASGATIVLFAAAVFCFVLVYNQIKTRLAVHEHIHKHGEFRHAHSHTHSEIHDHTHRDSGK